MIQKGEACLYRKDTNWSRICIYIYSSGKIKTYWSKVGKYTDKRKKILEKLKVNGCAICGYNKCTRALEFHHINPQDKSFSLIAWTMHKNPLLVAEELNKCILLCSNCHKEVEAHGDGIKLEDIE